MENKNESNPAPRHKWPWIVAGFVAFGFVLAIIWMTVLVQRMREQREYGVWPASAQRAQTNSLAPKTNALPESR